MILIYISIYIRNVLHILNDAKKDILLKQMAINLCIDELV